MRSILSLVLWLAFASVGRFASFLGVSVVLSRLSLSVTRLALASLAACIFLLWDLIADVGCVEGVLRQPAVQAGDPALLLDLLEALFDRLELVDELHRLDLVDLVEVANSPLDNFDQD